MDKQLLKDLKQKLEKESTLLEKDLLKFTEKNKNVQGDYITKYPNFGPPSASPDESAEELETYENRLAVEYALEARLKDVNQALEKIKKNNNSFSVCESCQKNIEMARLKVNPAAKICMDCGKKNKE